VFGFDYPDWWVVFYPNSHVTIRSRMFVLVAAMMKAEAGR
jgi:hypothetical protein